MNKMFAIIGLAMAAFVVSSPANALTLAQMQNEVAGMHCSGSTCTSSTYGTRAEPTTVESEVVIGHTRGSEHSLTPQDHCGFWGKFGNLNADCVPYSLSTAVGAAITKTVTNPGPDRIIETETIVTKTIGYHPDAPARDQLWSVTTEVVTRDR